MPCNIGRYQSSGGLPYCLPCVPGEYQNGRGESSCKKCGVNTKSNSTAATECSDCSVGQFSTGGSAQCTACVAGTAGALCDDCVEGKYRSGSDGQAAFCRDCPIGFSQSIPGQASCLKCIPGQYNDESGQSTCKNCLPSTYSKEQGRKTLCSTCSLGEEATTGGLSSCTPCDIGRHGIEGGRCRDCELGKFQDDKSSTECKESCPTKGKVPSMDGKSCTKPDYRVPSDCNNDQYLNNTSVDPKNWTCVSTFVFLVFDSCLFSALTLLLFHHVPGRMPTGWFLWLRNHLVSSWSIVWVLAHSPRRAKHRKQQTSPHLVTVCRMVSGDFSFCCVLRKTKCFFCHFPKFVPTRLFGFPKHCVARTIFQ